MKINKNVLEMHLKISQLLWAFSILQYNSQERGPELLAESFIPQHLLRNMLQASSQM